MLNTNISSLTKKNWLVKLAFSLGIAGISLLVSFPVLARYYPRYALFQPSAYTRYPYRSSESNIANTLVEDSKFSNFVYELKTVGLLKELQKKGSFTIFAPTNDAFNALPEDVFQRYSQPENRIRVLKYHLVAGEITPKQVDSGSITTVEGNQVKITVNDDSSVKINDANGKHPSTLTNNGVIIEVDKVLLYPRF